MENEANRIGRILVLYFSQGGHTKIMAELVAEGAASIPLTEVRLKTVAQATAQDLIWCDGIAAGAPTHMGTIPWEMKQWWDVIAQPLWPKVDGKIGCAFTSSGGLAGGGELTCLALQVVMMNYGMLVFGVPDYVAPGQTLHYGAICAGRPRSDAEREACRRLGRRLCEWVQMLVCRRPRIFPVKNELSQIPTRVSPCRRKYRSKRTIDFIPGRFYRPSMNPAQQFHCLALVLSIIMPSFLRAQTPAVPAWAQPGSATRTQVAPPSEFHRASKNYDTPIGLFAGQSDIGSAVIPGSATYDSAIKQYTINSAGYNVWYTRDEFRFLWKKMSGDVSLAADIHFPGTNGYGDRKAVLMIRQDLEDDSKEAFVALHGEGMIQLAQRPEKDLRVKDMEYRIGGRGRPTGASPDTLVTVDARRIGIEKHGDSFALFVSLEGEPMHQFGPPIQLQLRGTFYVGIGFCSHLPDKSDTAVFSNVALKNSAGKVE